jgi:hypothetical protein
LKKLLIACGVCVVAAFLFVASAAFFFAQRADYGWTPGVSTPTFTTERPRVLFDEGHNNASSISLSGRYWPFGRLLRTDGFELERGTTPFTAESLAGVRVLVIANAAGAPKPQFFGLNLPVATNKLRSDPAFAAAEVSTIRAWVERGGSLLLIADHSPFGAAASAMAQAFGVTMHKGFVEVPGERSDPLLFSVENGRIGSHPILTGAAPGDAIRRVMTYTGQSLDGPNDASVLLRLPPSAVEGVPSEDAIAERRAGVAQGLALQTGQGRVVVLGEGGMVTAQVYRGEHYGISAADNDNRQFVLNVMRWLARAL